MAALARRAAAGPFPGRGDQCRRQARALGQGEGAQRSAYHIVIRSTHTHRVRLLEPTNVPLLTRAPLCAACAPYDIWTSWTFRVSASPARDWSLLSHEHVLAPVIHCCTGPVVHLRYRMVCIKIDYILISRCPVCPARAGPARLVYFYLACNLGSILYNMLNRYWFSDEGY